MKGYFVPDEQLRKAKGYDVLDQMYSRNPVFYSAVSYVTSGLFNFHRDTHFSIDCSQPKWENFFSNTLVNRYIPEGIYGHSHDLDGFLRGVLQALFVFGKAYFKIDYLGDVSDSNGTKGTIPRIRWLAVETMNVVYHKGKIEKFVQQYSNNCQHEPLRGAKVEFTPDEIFFVEWVFGDAKTKGISPMASLVSFAEEHVNFLQFMERQVYAMAHPEDHSLKIERARHSSWQKAKNANESSDLKIRATIGSLLNAPMTQYYETYQFIKIRKRNALIREYLLDQFNSQIMTVLSGKNGLPEPARIRLMGYLSSTEIEDLQTKFQKGQLSGNEVTKTLIDDMISSLTPRH